MSIIPGPAHYLGSCSVSVLHPMRHYKLPLLRPCMGKRSAFLLMSYPPKMNINPSTTSEDQPNISFQQDRHMQRQPGMCLCLPISNFINVFPMWGKHKFMNVYQNDPLWATLSNHFSVCTPDHIPVRFTNKISLVLPSTVSTSLLQELL